MSCLLGKVDPGNAAVGKVGLLSPTELQPDWLRAASNWSSDSVQLLLDNCFEFIKPHWTPAIVSMLLAFFLILFVLIWPYTIRIRMFMYPTMGKS